jgi:hypothetical protein
MRWHVLALRLDKPETKVLSKLAHGLASMEMELYDSMDGLHDCLDADRVYDLIERLSEVAQ